MRQLLLSLGLLLFLQGTAQENPRVGLVFSGGGARSIAQLGVYKVMEEEGVRVDHIGGTSMGAIIGGLLSLGYTYDDILHLLNEVDWDRLQSDQIPRERLSYSDKKRRERYVTRLDIRNWRVQLPQGLNSGHYVLKNLNFLFQQAGNISDFSALPIPFYCVATNLENGKPKVFESGDLSLALRASSAFPSIFFPIEIDGELYVDGGVMDNFPVDYMRQKNVDILIGIDVQNPSYTKDELTNAFRILEQISTLNNYFSNLTSDSLVDILIRLDLDNVGLFDFQKFQELLSIGYQYGEMHREVFREIAKQQKGGRNITALPLPVKNFRVSEFQIAGDLAKSYKFYFRELGLQKNETLSTKKLNRKIDEWMGSLRYSQIRYSVVPDTAGAYKLRLQVDVDTVLNRIGASIRYDDDFGAGVLLNYERRDLFFSNAHFNIDLVVSENPRTWIEYSTNLGPIPSIGIRFRSHRFRPMIYETGRALEQFRFRDESFDLFIQSTLKEVFAIGGGVQLERFFLSESINVLPVEGQRNSFINYYGYIDLDTYDRDFKPGKGIRINGLYRIIAERDNFDEFYIPTSILSTRFSQAMSFGSKWGLEYWSQGAFTIGPEVGFPYNIFLGGMGENYINYTYSFLGYRFMELVGRNATTVGVNLHYEVDKNQFITVRGNWGRMEASFGNLFDDGKWLDGYGLSYGVFSPLGPIEFTLIGSSNHKRIFTYLTLGFWF
jgi:NTE family protein